MSRGTIAVLTVKANQAAGVDLTSGAVAANASGHKMFNPAGRTLVVCYTDATGTVDLTFVSVADPFNRLGDLGPTTVGNSKYYAFGPFTNQLFSQQSGADLGYLYVNEATINANAKLNGLNI